MKTTTVTCAQCGSPVEKPSNEVNRSRKLGREFFCNHGCASTWVNAHREYRTPPEAADRLRGKSPKSALDEHSPFRYFMRLVNRRTGKNRYREHRSRRIPHGTDLDLPYLKHLWDSQGGKCAISGMPMVMAVRKGAKRQGGLRSPWQASLDRKDSAMGYTRGNVQFVTLIANLAKHEFPAEDVVTFARAVALWHSLRN